MDTLVTSEATTAPTTRAARRHALVVGVPVTALAVAGTLWAVLKGGTTGNDQLGSLPYVAAVALIAGAVLFAWLVPARIAARGTGLPLAIVSVPLLVAFWSALPLLLAVAAILVGTAHRAYGGAQRGRALVAVILGATVVVFTVVAILVG